jgi:DNA-binding Xre family transcriptional regulator
MLDMRLRLPDLMKSRGMHNAYSLMKASRGALTITTAVRLVDSDGKPKRIDMTTLDTLCDIFGVGPGELLERDKPRRK